MKVLVIPDVHGSSHWEYFVKKHKDMPVVFLGDYFDSFNKNERGVAAAVNLRNIINFAKNSEREVTLLVGNHDLENYWFYSGRCSGFIPDMYDIYHNIFIENSDMFKIAVEYEGWVFSHAGFSKVWVENLFNYFKNKIKDFDVSSINIVDFCNKLLKDKMVYCFTYNEYDTSGYGLDECQGPLWIRPACLVRSSYFDNQIVGHTELSDKNIMCVEHQDKKFIFPDSPGHDNCFILDTDNLPVFNKVNN